MSAAHPATAVACPTCLAPPGEACRSGIRPGRRKGWSPSGRKVGYVHAARHGAASAASAAAPDPRRVVTCTTCPSCNGWGMLYDGKARPRPVAS